MSGSLPAGPSESGASRRFDGLRRKPPYGKAISGTFKKVLSSVPAIVGSDLSLLYRTYEAFNARDIDAVLATMAPDVEWPNGWEGGHLVGHEAVRDYWTRQWASISPEVVPEGFMRLPDGRLRLDVRQTVRSTDGVTLSRGTVSHIYTFRDGLVSKMEIE